MTRLARKSSRFGVLVLLGLCAAAPASLLATAEPGSWEVSRSGSEPVRLCLATMDSLAQFEHRNAKCTRSVIRNAASSATVHYTCSNGEFGESVMSLITPRSVRVETQGISGGAPFKYTFQARRVGDCRAH